jgi:hypothetical protein
LLFAFSIWGQSFVSGRITDVNRNAIFGSRIVICNTFSGDSISAPVDSLGYFSIKLPEGDYNIKFEAPGYNSKAGIIQVFDGDTADLNIVELQIDNTFSNTNKVASQFSVTGNVRDEENKPVEFAAVRFLSSDSAYVAGVVTDENGYFRADIPSEGEYTMIISALGYNPEVVDVDINLTDIEVGTILLRLDNNQLGEVMVSAGYLTRVDGYLQIIPEKTLVKHSNTGYQLLNNLMLPGVSVDAFDGLVKLYGHEVSLYINGQPADYRMVQNLRPKDVRKIEYHDAPVGRYSTDFAAINFITKEPDAGGYITFDAQQTIGGYLDGKYNGFSKINRGGTSYYLFAGYNLKSAASDRMVKEENFKLQSMSIDREFDSSHGRNRDHGGYGQFMLRNSNDRRFISVSAGFVADRAKSLQYGKTTYPEPVNLTESTVSNKENNAISPKLNYFGQFNIRENDFLITAFNASYSHNKYDYTYMADEKDVLSDTRDKMLNLNTQLIYQLDIKHRNSVSFILMDVFKVASTDYIGTYASNQHMWNSEALAFVEYTHRLSNKFRFSVRPGLSMVNIGLRGYERQDFYFPRFFTQFSYNPTRKQQVNFSLSVGNAMSSLSSRTSAVQPIDMIMSRRGNPDLKDVKLYDASVNYSMQLGQVNFNSRLAMTYNADALTAGYSSEDTRLIIDVYNGTFKRAIFSPNVTWKITDALRGELGGELCHQSYWNKHDGKAKLNYASANLSLIYFVGDFSLNFKGSTVQRGLNSQFCYTVTPANMQLSVAWTHGNWRVDAWAKSLSRQTIRQNISTLYYQMCQQTNGRFCGMIKVAYTLEFGRKVQRERSKADTSIDSNIL